jgi:hypothetical protein
VTNDGGACGAKSSAGARALPKPAAYRSLALNAQRHSAESRNQRGIAAKERKDHKENKRRKLLSMCSLRSFVANILSKKQNFSG